MMSLARIPTFPVLNWNTESDKSAWKGQGWRVARLRGDEKLLLCLITAIYDDIHLYHYGAISVALLGSNCNLRNRFSASFASCKFFFCLSY